MFFFQNQHVVQMSFSVNQDDAFHLTLDVIRRTIVVIIQMKTTTTAASILVLLMNSVVTTGDVFLNLGNAIMKTIVRTDPMKRDVRTPRALMVNSHVLTEGAFPNLKFAME